MNPKNQRRALCRPRPIAAMVGFWLSMLAFFFCTLNSRAQGQGSPPGVKTQPQNQSVLAGSSATFSVIATGSPPLSYRWIGPTTSSLGPDATNAVLILPKVDAANGGAYFVEVTNQFGMVHSSNAFLFVTAMDFGDAPLPYPTMLTNDGARHIIVPGVYLGHGVSYEPDGQPDPQATADSLDDGVVFLTSLVRGNPAAVQVVASVNGFLDAWIDFRGSSNWQDTGNQIFTSVPLNPGTNILSFNVPAAAITGVTYARFRFSTSGNLRPNGLAQDGEVEDFRIPIVAVAADLCISNTIVPVPVLPGTIGHSLLLVTNIGPSVAANVIVTNVLAGVDFISVQAEGGSCTNQNDTIVCSLGNLALHETRNILIDFKPRQNSALTNFAFVRSDTPDPNPVNNRAVLAFRAAPPLVIVTPPRSQEVTIGGTVTFSVEAKGFGTLSYQWYSNGIPILDATGQTFTLQNAQDSAAFQVQVFDAFGNVFSPLAFLAVVKPPQLLGQPASLAVAHGTSIEFLTQATGTPPLRFQWRLNGLNIRGATNPVYLITNSTRFDAGTYTVAVGNDAGVITSEKALLTCTDIPIYNGSDAFANRTPLPPPGLPNASPFQGIVQTDNSNATREAGEPFHAGKLGGASIWYQWTAPANGIVSFDTAGSTFDTLLAVYTGIDLSALSATEAASDDDRGGFLRSQVSFNVVANQTYSIAIDGAGGATGTIILAWNLEQTSQTIPTFSITPRSRSFSEGSPMTLSVDIANPAGAQLNYQWLLNGTPIPGATSADYSVQSLQRTDVGSYWVRVSNTAGRAVESRPAVVELGTVSGVQSHDKLIDVFLDSSTGGPFRAAKSPSLPPFISVAFGVPGYQIMNNTNSTADIDCFQIGNATRWLGIVVTNAPPGSQLRIDTSGSGIATELGLYKFTFLSCLQSFTCMHTNLLGCDTNSSGGGGAYSQLQIHPTAGSQYLVFADGLNGAQGIIDVNWVLGSAPTVIPALANCVLSCGAGTNFTLVCGITNGAPAPSYQWYCNGAVVPGATSSNFNFAPLQSTNAGTYTVIASNIFGTATNTCCLVLTPPTLYFQSAFTNAQLSSLTLSAALMPNTVLQATTNLNSPIQWLNLFTNLTTNCNFLFSVPLLDSNGQSYPQRFFRTRAP